MVTQLKLPKNVFGELPLTQVMDVADSTRNSGSVILKTSQDLNDSGSYLDPSERVWCVCVRERARERASRLAYIILTFLHRFSIQHSEGQQGQVVSNKIGWWDGREEEGLRFVFVCLWLHKTLEMTCGNSKDLKFFRSLNSHLL